MTCEGMEKRGEGSPEIIWVDKTESKAEAEVWVGSEVKREDVVII